MVDFPLFDWIVPVLILFPLMFVDPPLMVETMLLALNTSACNLSAVMVFAAIFEAVTEPSTINSPPAILVT